MTSVVPDRRAVRQALERESGRVAGLVRDSAPLDGSVPGLDWTRAQLIAHLCAISEAFAATLRGEDFVARFGAQFVGSYGTGPTFPEAVAATKTLIPQVWGRTIEGATAMTAAAIATRRVSPEGQEGLRAFLEKRKASWWRVS